MTESPDFIAVLTSTLNFNYLDLRDRICYLEKLIIDMDFYIQTDYVRRKQEAAQKYKAKEI